MEILFHGNIVLVKQRIINIENLFCSKIFNFKILNYSKLFLNWIQIIDHHFYNLKNFKLKKGIPMNHKIRKTLNLNH